MDETYKAVPYVEIYPGASGAADAWGILDTRSGASVMNDDGHPLHFRSADAATIATRRLHADLDALAS